MPPTTRFVLREQESALRPELDIAATRADVSLGPNPVTTTTDSECLLSRSLLPNRCFMRCGPRIAPSDLFARCFLTLKRNEVHDLEEPS